MPLVYVHGVGNRASAEYDAGVAARTALFRSFLLPVISSTPDKATVLNPYWGQYGATFAWNRASFPKAKVTTLGLDNEAIARLVADATLGEAATADTVLVVAAKRSLEQAVDLLWALTASAARNEHELADLAAWASKVAAYAAEHPAPAWLNEATDDQRFVQLLSAAVEDAGGTAGTLGLGDAGKFGQVWDNVGEQVGRLARLPAWTLSRGAVALGREAATNAAVGLLGDVLVYLGNRGTDGEPGPIVREVAAQLRQAHEARSEGDPHLVVVSHSMGGNIVYDILTSWLPLLGPDFRLDAWITVGTQVGLFEELKLFRASQPGVPTDPATERVAKPAAVGHWLNIFDQNDSLGFATEGIFAETTDFGYSTGKTLLAAHGSYFSLPSFHQRLAKRVGELFR